MPILPSDFAEECVRQAIRFGVNGHYLIAAAKLRSGISDRHARDRFSAFRLTQGEWDANCFDAELGITDFLPGDVKDWDMQCVIYALMTRQAQNRLLDRLGRYPSAVELYEEQWPDDAVDLASRLQAAVNETAEFYEEAVAAGLPPAPAEASTIGQAEEPTVPVITIPAGPTPTASDELFVKKAPWIMEKLINDFDLTEVRAAGILGNIGHECNGFRNFQEIKPLGGGRGGFGWCQWTGPRRDQFAGFCRSQGLDSLSDAANYGFLKLELETTEKQALNAIRKAETLSEAVRVFEQKFERAHPDHKHYDRREQWAQMALDSFQRFKDRLPAVISKVLDADVRYEVLARVNSGSTDFFLIEQFTDDGGQLLVSHTSGEQPEILASDTSIFPLPVGLVPEAVAEKLAGHFDPDPAPEPSAPAPSGDGDASSRMLAQAKACNETLVSRKVPNTNNGRLACAWAVNEVARRAFGKPIGGGLSTIEMDKVLRQKHRLVPEGQMTAGMIVMSPTQGRNVGHVGIVGTLQAPLSKTVIYSNSSRRGVYSDHFTIEKWKAFYGTRKGLPVSFYALNTPL